MLTERERAVIAHYDARAKAGIVDMPLWADGHTAALYSGLPFASKFLDAGCGNGRFIGVLKPLGFEPSGYVGIDPSEEQVKLGRELNPGYHFEVGSLFDVGERYPDTFEGFCCVAVLPFLPRERIPTALASLRTSLKKGAVGLITTPLGEGERESLRAATPEAIDKAVDAALNQDEAGALSASVLITLMGAGELEGMLTAAGFYARVRTYDHMLHADIQAL